MPKLLPQYQDAFLDAFVQRMIKEADAFVMVCMTFIVRRCSQECVCLIRKSSTEWEVYIHRMHSHFHVTAVNQESLIKDMWWESPIVIFQY